MIRFSASSLSALGGAVASLKRLDKEIGIEIFYEFASEDMWRHVLTEAMEGRTGEFTIHSPFHFADICYSEEKELFRELMVPFDLYHRFDGQFYVLHSHGHGKLPEDPDERARLREKVTGRIARFADICENEGVRLAVENLFGGSGPLFDQQQYIELFEQVPKAYSLIDIGHAMIGHYDVEEVQKAMGSRLIGYHIHDNDGIHDSHWRAFAENGIRDWEKFCQGVKTYTPDATLVMEYAHATLAEYKEDMDKLKELL